MQKEQILLFQGSDGIVRCGKVIFYEDWYEKHKRGETGKIFDVIIEDEDYLLREEDIKGVIEWGKEEFKNKTGVSWEDYENGRLEDNYLV